MYVVPGVRPPYHHTKTITGVFQNPDWEKKGKKLHQFILIGTIYLNHQMMEWN